MTTERFSNQASTTLATSVGSGDLSISVQGTVHFPTQPEFRIRVGQELMLVTGVSGVTWTVTRGVESTSALAHAAGTAVVAVLTAGALDELRAEIEAEDRTASGIRTATTVVAVAAATAPIAGQVLTAISDTQASWQNTSRNKSNLFLSTPNKFGSRAAIIRQLDNIFAASRTDFVTGSVADQRFVGASPATASGVNRPTVELATANHPQQLSFNPTGPNYLIEQLGTLMNGPVGTWEPSFTFWVTYRPTSQLADSTLLGILEIAIYGGFGSVLFLANDPAIVYNNVVTGSPRIATAYGDRANCWRTLVFAYNGATGDVMILDRGHATYGVEPVPGFTFHLIGGQVAVGAAANGFNSFNGKMLNWGFDVNNIPLTLSEGLALREYQYAAFNRVVLCVGDSITAGSAGPSVLGYCLDNVPATVALEASYTVGAVGLDTLIAGLDTYVAPAFIPQSDMVFFWMTGNSISNFSATLDDMKNYARSIKSWMTAHDKKWLNSLILPRTSFTSAQNAIVAQWNAFMLANPSEVSHGVGYVMDPTTVPILQDPAGSGYVDGTHPSIAGASAFGVYAAPFFSL